MYIFLDTNIFLHFKQFDQIDWEKITNSPEVNIVIAPQVISELDKHKRNTYNKIAKRAKNTLNKIEKLLEIKGTQDRNKINIEYINKSPKEITFNNHSLNLNEADDCILSSILEYKEDHPNKDIVLIAHDTGIRLKAKRLFIDTIIMPDEYILPNEKSEIEKENEILKSELTEFKNRIPKLKLWFIDKNNFLSEKITFKNIDIKNVIKTDINNIKEETTKLSNEANENNLNGLNKLMFSYIFSPLSEQRIDEYNKKLENYFVDYEKYLEEKFKYLNNKSLTIKIELILLNEGNCPAENIDIILHFPDGFEIKNEDEFNNAPHEPKKPYRPKHNLDYDLGILERDYSIGIYNEKLINSNSARPKITKTNSYDIKYHLDDLKHFQDAPLAPLFLTFPSYDKIINFQFIYKISCANIPNLIEGSLNVKVEKMLINE